MCNRFAERYRDQLAGVMSIVVRHWPVILIVLSIPCTILLGLILCDKGVSLFTTAILVATLIAVTWYSYETRVLRLRQESTAEVENHPWLGVELLGSKSSQEADTLTTRENYHFGLRNSGTTPAYDVTLKGKWKVAAEHGAEQPEDTFEMSLGVLSPNTVSACDIPIHWELVTRIVIAFEVSYRTCLGGGGRLRYEYRFEQPGRVTSTNENLEFWLSNGTRFPIKQTKNERMV